MHLFLARILVIGFGFLMALSSILDYLRKFIIEEKRWNRGASKCLDILMEGMVDYRRL